MICCAESQHEEADLVFVDEPLVYEACIERRKNRGLGLEVDFVPSRKVLPVRSLIPHQLVMEWNQTHEEFAIMPGDRIVSVNGVSGNADEMIMNLRDPSQVSTRIKLVRMSREADDRVILNAVDIYPCQDSSSPKALGAMFTGLAIFGCSCGCCCSCCQAQPKDSTDDASTRSTSNGINSQPPAERVRRAVLLDEARHGLSPAWLAVWSRSQSKYYYFNPETRESSWTRPMSGGSESSGSGNGSIQGSWTYPDGSFKISKHVDELWYREDAHGVGGVIEEDGGWLVAPLRRLRSGEDPSWDSAAEIIGRVRFLRRGNRLISNFQQVGQADEWEPDVIANETGTDPDGKEALVGVWHTADGSFTVRFEEDELVYKESKYGIFGYLKEDVDGWYVASLAPLDPDDENNSIGWIRLKRRGPQLVSSFQGTDDVAWEPECFATKDQDSMEGSWEYSDGTFAVTNENGFLIYEEPSCGIYGVLEQGKNGWMTADLHIPLTSTSRVSRDSVGGGSEEQHLGKMRLQRRGNKIVTNFCPVDSDKWERNIVATRMGGDM